MLSLILAAVWTLGLATPPTVTMMPTVLPIPGDVAAVDRATLVREGIIINDFDPPAQRWQAGHRGIDLRASDATELYTPPVEQSPSQVLWLAKTWSSFSTTMGCDQVLSL